MSSRRDQTATTPDLTATMQVPSSMTPDQNEQIFELMRQKLAAEVAATEGKARLERELIKKESDARIAASTAAATAAGPGGGTVQRKTLSEDDDIIGEVPPEVSSISLRFAGLPQEEIIRIFHNKFKAINLYRLRHMRGLRYETF